MRKLALKRRRRGIEELEEGGQGEDLEEADWATQEAKARYIASIPAARRVGMLAPVRRVKAHAAARSRAHRSLSLRLT